MSNSFSNFTSNLSLWKTKHPHLHTVNLAPCTKYSFKVISNGLEGGLWCDVKGRIKVQREKNIPYKVQSFSTKDSLKKSKLHAQFKA